MNALVALASLALATAGFTVLAMAMQRYEGRVFPAPGACQTQCASARVSGVQMLVASLMLCLHADGTSVGPVLWCALLTLAGWAVTGLLALRPRWLPRAAMLLVGCAALLTVLSKLAISE